MTRPAAPPLTFGWGSAELLPAGPYAVTYRAPTCTVGIALERQVGVHAFASDRRRPFDAWPNTLAFTPADMDVYSASERGGEYLLVRVERARAEEGLAPWGAGRTDERRTWGGQERAGALARTIRRLMLAGRPEDAEGPLLALLACCAAALGGSGRRSARGRGAVQGVARALEIMEARLDAPLTLLDLAGAVGSTPLRLLRAFRAAVGTTPHAFLRERRLARARALLAGGVPIAEAALSSGFSSQAHLTATMRQLLGCTPGMIVRGLGGDRPRAHAPPAGAARELLRAHAGRGR